MQAIYDTIGKGYNTTRRADPYITERMYSLLSPVPGGLYLDIGCGTGNYLAALEAMGVQLYGIDPSERMLNEARAKNPDATLINAAAHGLPIPDDFFDGAIAMFTLHHWQQLQAGLADVNRVLKPGSRLACLSFTPEQLRGYWLHHYFPGMIERSMQTIPALPEMEAIFNTAGFSLTLTEKYFIQDDLQDHFLYSHKRRPGQYLLPEVRNGASSFTAFSEPKELADGLVMLEADIYTGRINEVMRDYENDLGDYLFLVATADL